MSKYIYIIDSNKIKKFIWTTNYNKMLKKTIKISNKTNEFNVFKLELSDNNMEKFTKNKSRNFLITNYQNIEVINPTEIKEKIKELKNEK